MTWLVIGVLFAGTDLFLGGYRIYFLAHRLAPSVGVLDAIRADLGNKSLAGITPWQTGGGAAQLYVLHRAGLPVSGGVACGTINFLVSTLMLAVLGVLLLVTRPQALPSWLEISTTWTIVFFFFLVVLGVFILGRSPTVRDPNAPPPKSRIVRFIDRARRFVRSSLDTARSLLKAHPGPVVMLFPITAGIFLSKFAYTYAVFRAFQPEGHWGELVGVLLILLLSLFFAPTPGASGVAEGSATAFLAATLGPSPSVGFVLYWRLLSLYLPVVAGGVVLLRLLARDSRVLRRRP